MDKEIYSTVITNAHDTKELAYFNLMNHMQSQHGSSVVFDSFKQLNLLVWATEPPVFCFLLLQKSASAFRSSASVRIAPRIAMTEPITIPRSV